ncbi:MAG: hypothetical protein HY290_14310 [Planctomycetia bacterium]|nr:hypothetical protein [Planctomycetia bacterium]
MDNSDDDAREDRWKVIGGVAAIVVSVGCILTFILFVLAPEYMPPKEWMRMAAGVCAVIWSAQIIRDIVRWTNRRDDQQRSQRPPDAP